MPPPAVPNDPLIFHITHVNNLPSIIGDRYVWSDAQRIARGTSNISIGHLHIKQRRLTRTVDTHSNGMLGDYVPFNFCSRSVMLFLISCGHGDWIR